MLVTLRHGLVFFLVIYHKILSPLLPRACRFYPSCSVYALESMKRHGIVKGAFLSLRRIARCHPWNPGGYDPAR